MMRVRLELFFSMSNSDVKFRKSLNNSQLLVLEWLYEYRFSTSKQLAILLNKSNHKSIQDKLKILESQKFIGKRYDSTYKLAGRAAEYYLTPAGGRKLNKHYIETNSKKTIHEPVTKALYKNKLVSSAFISHCLSIVSVAQKLHTLYGEKMHIFSQAGTAPYHYFPVWRPDLYINLRLSKHQPYFLDVWDDSKPFFISVKKSRNYMNHEENDGWYDNTPYPYILAVCKDAKTQSKLNRQIKKALEEKYNDNLTYATTTISLFMKSQKTTERIWTKINQDDEPEEFSLKNLYE